MESAITRRTMLAAAAGVCITPLIAPSVAIARWRPPIRNDPLFRISLAQWSLHPLLHKGEIDNLGFITEARRLGFDAIEYVNSFFKDKATDDAYLAQMNARAKDADVRQLLIMCDGEGRLGDPDRARRTRAVENHRKWIDAAAALGCHSIRVNAASEGSWAEQARLASDGLASLTEFGAAADINVIVENHGGLSSNGRWLAEVMRAVNSPRCGTLPDFGNFCMDWSRADDPDAWYDRYKGVEELMPFAKAVSAKSHEFDDDGNEVRTDYTRMLRIVLDAGYRGWIGVEYEGNQHPPRQGTLMTKRLLERTRAILKPEYAKRKPIPEPAP